MPSPLAKDTPAALRCGRCGRVAVYAASAAREPRARLRTLSISARIGRSLRTHAHGHPRSKPCNSAPRGRIELGLALAMRSRRGPQKPIRNMESAMSRKRVTWIPAVLLAIALAGASCSSHDDGGGAPTSPGGGNGSGSTELNSPVLTPGDSFEHLFWAAGTYNYYCIFHPAMIGSVVVDANAPDTLVRVSITNPGAPFPGATVRTGGRVVWTNDSSMNHTVTSQ